MWKKELVSRKKNDFFGIMFPQCFYIVWGPLRCPKQLYFDNTRALPFMLPFYLGTLDRKNQPQMKSVIWNHK